MKSVCLLICSMYEILFYLVYMFTGEQGSVKLQCFQWNLALDFS